MSTDVSQNKNINYESFKPILAKHNLFWSFNTFAAWILFWEKNNLRVWQIKTEILDQVVCTFQNSPPPQKIQEIGHKFMNFYEFSN